MGENVAYTLELLVGLAREDSEGEVVGERLAEILKLGVTESRGEDDMSLVIVDVNDTIALAVTVTESETDGAVETDTAEEKLVSILGEPLVDGVAATEREAISLTDGCIVAVVDRENMAESLALTLEEEN